MILSFLQKLLRAKSARHGFTLIEVLIVIGLIAILASIVVVAINPNRQFAQARNTQRTSDVNAILNAIYQYAVDNNGSLPANVSALVADAAPAEICNTTGATCGTLVDLGVLTASERYLTAIPTDPQAAAGVNSKYTIVRTANNRLIIAAPQAEISATISIKR